MNRSFSELKRFDTFEDRYEYLKLCAAVGETTFGSERYLNQSFYNSAEWRRVRQIVILRDNACDLGILGREIHQTIPIYIHHMNPMRPEDVLRRNPKILDPEYLITVTFRTHNAIHYGDENQLQKNLVERRPGDTKLW